MSELTVTAVEVPYEDTTVFRYDITSVDPSVIALGVTTSVAYDLLKALGIHGRRVNSLLDQARVGKTPHPKRRKQRSR